MQRLQARFPAAKQCQAVDYFFLRILSPRRWSATLRIQISRGWLSRRSCFRSERLIRWSANVFLPWLGTKCWRWHDGTLRSCCKEGFFTAAGIVPNVSCRNGLQALVLLPARLQAVEPVSWANQEPSWSWIFKASCSRHPSTNAQVNPLPLVKLRSII